MQLRASYIDDEGHRAGHWRSLSRLEKACFPFVVDLVRPYRGNRESGRRDSVHVIANKPSEMLFVQRDDMIQNFPAAASDPSFRNSILPGCLHTRALRLQAGSLQKCNHIGIEFRVVVDDGITLKKSKATITTR
jgi:hypothetical protein